MSRLQREPVLFAGLIVVIVAFFAVTSILVGRYHEQEARLGQQWFQRGEDALQNHQPAQAIEDYRSALAYSRDDEAYRLRLAQALIAARRPQEARAHLLNLWETEPGDGVVNLELARLAAEEGDVHVASRYYHAAIEGLWAHDPIHRRIQVRFELSELLLRAQRSAQAQAELIALAAVLPPDDASTRVRLGQLLLQTNDSPHALQQFRTALVSEPNSHDALAGAGLAAFRMQDYGAARVYLERAIRLDRSDTASADMLATSTLVLSMDPFARGLNARDRSARAVQAFHLALTRLEQCVQAGQLGALPSNLASAYNQGKDMERQVRESTLARNSDLLESTMRWVFLSERAAANACGSPSQQDAALLLIAQKREAGAA